MLATTNFGVMCFKSIMDGVVEASFLSTVTAMTLGVAGKTRFHRKVSRRMGQQLMNEIMDSNAFLARAAE